VSGALIIVSKSRWEPAVRREHALARQAADHDIQVLFIERPIDVRAVGSADWRLAAGHREAPGPEGITVLPHAVPVPGHRSGLAERAAASLLRRRLRSMTAPGDTVVVCTPWQWPATRGLLAGVRRVFDCADDWSALLPRRAEAIHARFGEIAAEADAVVLVSDDLVSSFPGAAVTVVPNGVEQALLVTAREGAPRPRSMVYLGTLSERFDAPLVGDLLRALPDWRLDLYGQCQYGGLGERPAPELEQLLGSSDRVAWHGPVARDGVAAVLDRAQVAILPNRPELTSGQDAMKLYDYAARGLPVVSTRWSDRLASDDAPPGLALADDAAAFAAAVTAAAAHTDTDGQVAVRWAAQRTWDRRWDAWSAAALRET
jgi:glycosyltransferase involved in cell wall biosynthesis